MSANHTKLKIYGHLALLKLSQIVAYDCSLNDAAKRVFPILVGYADTKYYCFPSFSKIGKELGLSRQAISKQVKILQESGYLVVIEKFDDNKRQETNDIYFKVTDFDGFLETPYIFSKRNVEDTLICFVYLYLLRRAQPNKVSPAATELGFGREQLNKDTLPVTQLGCSKNNNIRKHKKEKIKDMRDSRLKRTEWKYTKNREGLGITKEDDQSYKDIYDDLRKLISVTKAVEFEVSLSSQTGNMDIKEALLYRKNAIKNKINEIKQPNINN